MVDTRAVDPLRALEIEVEQVIGAPAEVVWALVTDLTLTPLVNRETADASWLPPASGPATGAAFRATNVLGEQRWTVDCHVTRCEAPRAFEWTVLEPANPSSSWWYRLTPTGPTETTVHHGFRHGPNRSGLRRRIEADPASAEAIIEFRLDMLRSNMVHTLTQFAQRAEARATDPA